MSLFSKAVKSVTSNPGNVLKKVAQVNIAGAVGVVTGFATGGVPGAIVGGASAGINAAQAVSKEGHTSNKRLLRESLGFGAVGGTAAGVVTSTGIAGSASSAAKSILTRGAGFAKSGLSGLAVNAVKSGLPLIASYFNPKTGVVPGTDTTVSDATSEAANVANKALKGYRKFKEVYPGVKDVAADIRQNGIGNADLSKLKGIFNAEANPPEPVGNQSDNSLLYVALGLGALMLA